MKTSLLILLVAAATLAAPELDAQENVPEAEAAPADLAPPVDGSLPGPVETGEEPVKALEFLERAEFAVALVRDNNRALDPFGLPMDPANAIAAPILADQYSELDEVPVLNNSSLKSALETLPISGIYPDKHLIVLGARSFRPGEVFGMKLEELTIRLRFEGIKGTSVYFRDMDTQEVSSVDFNPRPKEFEPIARGAKPGPIDGIQPMGELFIVN